MTGRRKSGSANISGLVRSALGLGEQLVQSALNLALVAALLKYGGLESVGIYATARFGMLLFVGISNALIAFPYTFSFRKLTSGEQTSHAGGHLHLLTASLTATLFGGWIAAIGYCLLAGQAWWSLDIRNESIALPMLLAMTAALPMFLLREFSRRYEFAQLRVGFATTLTGMTSILQLAGLAALIAIGMLNAVTALALIAASCGLTNVLWMLARRREFTTPKLGARTLLSKNWTTGKWMFGSQLLPDLLLLAVQGGLTMLASPQSAGAFAAVFSLVGLANTLIAGLSNLFPATFSKALADGGPSQLLRQIRTTTMALAAFVAVIVCGLYLGGEWLIARFNDEPTESLQVLIGILGLSVLIRAIGQPASHALNTLDQPYLAFTPRLIGFFVAAIFGVATITMGAKWAGWTLLVFQALSLALTFRNLSILFRSSRMEPRR